MPSNGFNNILFKDVSMTFEETIEKKKKEKNENVDHLIKCVLYRKTSTVNCKKNKSS